MSKAVLIIGVLGAALCMCCILIALGVFAMSDGPAPAPSPSASGSSGSSGSSRSSGSSGSDDSDDEPEASESSTNNQASSVEEEEDEGHPVTRDGRCGPGHGNTRCGGKACCSQWNWCGGEQGTHSAWCSGSNDVTGAIGHWGGEYDGTG